MIDRTPNAEIRTNAASRVPTILPSVLSAYSMPATLPTPSTDLARSRTAYGETVAMSALGMKNRTVLPISGFARGP